MVSNQCPYCDNPVNKDDPLTWKGVTGWVHGPKAHAMTLRENTGLYAHDECIKKVRAGQAPDQVSLLDEDTVLFELPPLAIPSDIKLAEELFDESSK